MAIAALARLEKNRVGYEVPSQAGNGSYVVNVDGEPHQVGVVKDACSLLRAAQPVPAGEVQRGRLHQAAEGVLLVLAVGQGPYADYSVYVMRQASRRSWRIGQTRPVKVVFMSYRNTLQADALKLVAKKMQSSLAVEGELPEDGLAAYGDDGDDMMMALARKIVSGGEEDDAETVEGVLAQARDAEAASEEFLVDDGWKVVEVEPEAVEVNGNGTNGHHANGIGPTVELVLANGHHANGNGHAAVEINGHRSEAPEPQQTLFSWAEFMAEEPVRPKGRSRKAQPATASLFDWALTLEQEREKELVGAGR